MAHVSTLVVSGLLHWHTRAAFEAHRGAITFPPVVHFDRGLSSSDGPTRSPQHLFSAQDHGLLRSDLFCGFAPRSPYVGLTVLWHPSLIGGLPASSAVFCWVSWLWHPSSEPSGSKDTQKPEPPLSPSDRLMSKLYVGNCMHLCDTQRNAHRLGKSRCARRRDVHSEEATLPSPLDPRRGQGRNQTSVWVSKRTWGMRVPQADETFDAGEVDGQVLKRIKDARLEIHGQVLKRIKDARLAHDHTTTPFLRVHVVRRQSKSKTTPATQREDDMVHRRDEKERLERLEEETHKGLPESHWRRQMVSIPEHFSCRLGHSPKSRRQQKHDSGVERTNPSSGQEKRRNLRRVLDAVADLQVQPKLPDRLLYATTSLSVRKFARQIRTAWRLTARESHIPHATRQWTRERDVLRVPAHSSSLGDAAREPTGVNNDRRPKSDELEPSTSLLRASSLKSLAGQRVPVSFSFSRNFAEIAMMLEAVSSKSLSKCLRRWLAQPLAENSAQRFCAKWPPRWGNPAKSIHVANTTFWVHLEIIHKSTTCPDPVDSDPGATFCGPTPDRAGARLGADCLVQDERAAPSPADNGWLLGKDEWGLSSRTTWRPLTLAGKCVKGTTWPRRLDGTTAGRVYSPFPLRVPRPWIRCAHTRKFGTLPGPCCRPALATTSLWPSAFLVEICRLFWARCSWTLILPMKCGSELMFFSAATTFASSNSKSLRP